MSVPVPWRGMRLRRCLTLCSSDTDAMKLIGVTLVAAIGLAACSGSENPEYAYPDDRANTSDFYAKEQPGLFGGDGLTLFGGKDEENQPGGSGIAVNSFLWRASLDTVSYMPLASADPFGGVIITDWYSAPEAAAGRTKVQVYILSRELRSDGLRVALFRERQQDGQWVAAPVSPRTIRQIEDSILARARELRLKSSSPS